MSEFVAGFTMRLNGKISDEDLRIVSDELEIYVDKWTIEHKSTALVLPKDAIPNEYKEYIVSAKLRGLSDATLRCYNQTMIAFFLTLRTPVRDITTPMIKRYLLSYSQCQHGTAKGTVSAHTLDNMRGHINSFFEWCVDNEIVMRNPCRTIERFRYQKKPVDVISKVELERLKAACESKRDLAMICVLYITAARVSEFASIKKSDIRWSDTNKHGVVPIDIVGKGGKPRVIYLDAEANVALRRYLDSRRDDCPYVFVSERAPYQKLTVRAVQQIVAKLGEKAGNKGLHPHELRHTRATDFCRSSGNILLASKMLGHSNVTTTQAFYVVTDQDELENEISKGV